MIHRRRRAGYALIEMLAVITVLTALLGLCAGMIHLLLKLDRSGRDALEVASDLSRLADDFRADAHDAPPGEPAVRSADRMVLPLDGSKSVEYAIRPGDVLRTLREGDKVRRFETYRRPPRVSARLDVATDAHGSTASLVFDRPPDGADGPLFHDYRIEAQLGKHRPNNPPRPE